MESVSSKAKKLLESLSSLSDGCKKITALENQGKQQGWGLNRTGGFMRQNICASTRQIKIICLEIFWHLEWVSGIHAIRANTVGKKATIVQNYVIRVVCLYFQNEIYR